MRSKRFEALAKRPVNQDGFVKEWIEEGANGWVVDLSKTGTLAAALENLCAAAGNSAMRDRARTAVEHLDLSRMSERLLALYQALLRIPNSPHHRT